MNTRHTWIVGLAALGFALAAPAQAAPDGLDGSFMVAKNDSRDDVRQAPRDENKGTRSSTRREAERTEPQGYGYGYERRQQDQPSQGQPGNKGNAPRQPRH